MESYFKKRLGYQVHSWSWYSQHEEDDNLSIGLYSQDGNTVELGEITITWKPNHYMDNKTDIIVCYPIGVLPIMFTFEDALQYLHKYPTIKMSDYVELLWHEWGFNDFTVYNRK